MTDLKKHFSDVIADYKDGFIGANAVINEVVDVLSLFGADSVLVSKRDELLAPFVDELVKCIENDGNMAFNIEGWKKTDSNKDVVNV